MARTSYSRRKKRSEDIKGYIIIFISGIVLLCLFGIYFFVSKNTVVLTKDTLCPVNGPHGHTVFLIDRTDTYSKIQIAQIEKYLAQFQSEIPKHNELSIYDINSDPDNSLTPVFKMCNPGDGSDIDNWESLATNKNQIKQKYDEKFSDKLNETLNNMLLPNTEDISPIFEMIKVVAVKAFPLVETKNGNHLIIISDMLHNSSDYSHYQSNPDVNSFKNSNFRKKINVDLTNTKFNILYVERANYANLQNNNHKNFWISVFVDLFYANKTSEDPFIIIN